MLGARTGSTISRIISIFWGSRARESQSPDGKGGFLPATVGGNEQEWRAPGSQNALEEMEMLDEKAWECVDSWVW